jgi:hypothetical protein
MCRALRILCAYFGEDGLVEEAAEVGAPVAPVDTVE